MKQLLLVVFIYLANKSFTQKSLVQYNIQFNTELKLWKSTFHNFNLADFKVTDTAAFENNFPQDFDGYKAFLSTYKPILSYSSDRSKFIDIYSYQLNLERKGNHYEATPEIDQAVFLCNPKQKYWNRICFGGTTNWIDEVAWVNSTTFILAGIVKDEQDKKMPVLYIGETEKQTMVRYINTKNFQGKENYRSPKLKRIKITGL